ncbi:MAG: hypothetical protein AABX33_06595 [Nanoarchaeota archaeon]
MGDYFYLEIIEKKNKEKQIIEIERWKYTIPKENSIFNFIFKESDFIKKRGTCYFRIKMPDAINRLKIHGLDDAEIINDISKFLNVSKNDAKLALLIEDDYDDVTEPLKEFTLENNIKLWKDEDYEEPTKEFDKYSEMSEKLDLIDITNLKTLYYYNIIFKKYNKPNYYLQLNFEEIIAMGVETKQCKEIIISDKDDKITLNKEYLFMAKKHFSEHHYDLVYVELIIVLERILKQAIIKKKGTKNFQTSDFEKIFQDLSLMHLLKFYLYYLNSSNINLENFATIQDIYNRRNNIIHSSQKKFDKLQCAKDIRIIEKICDEIKSFEEG